jgi:hypothetical protein
MGLTDTWTTFATREAAMKTERDNRPVAFDYHGIYVEWADANVEASLLAQLKAERQHKALIVTGIRGPGKSSGQPEKVQHDGSLISEAENISDNADEWL